MIAEGQNLYRVYFKYKMGDLRDREFTLMIVAFSSSEAESYICKNKVVVKTQLVEENISIFIPKQYLAEDV